MVERNEGYQNKISQVTDNQEEALQPPVHIPESTPQKNSFIQRLVGKLNGGGGRIQQDPVPTTEAHSTQSTGDQHHSDTASQYPGEIPTILKSNTTEVEEHHTVPDILIGRSREFTTLGDKPIVDRQAISGRINDMKERFSNAVRVGAAATALYGGGAEAVNAHIQSSESSPIEHAVSNPFPSVEDHYGLVQENTLNSADTTSHELHSTPEIQIQNEYFRRTWDRTDKPIADGVVSRTWMWGNPVSGELTESYDEAPGGRRVVQYFDKSRMEITYPDGDKNSPWYVTNGLLAKDLITGKMQVGDNRFVEKGSAHINVAGDPGTDGVTYATFNEPKFLDPVAQKRDTEVETSVLHPDGSVTTDESLARYGVTYSDWRPETGHNIPKPFRDFMNSVGPVFEDGQIHNDAIFESYTYATGLPITEAYWTEVMVGGQPKMVLVQAFERRVLTYTPGNPEGWQVEAGNVGQHYYEWEKGSVEEPSPEIPNPERPFPNEIGDLEKHSVKIHNRGVVIGVADNTESENNFDTFARAIEDFFPEEKFELYFYDNKDDVPEPTEPNNMDENINWGMIVDGAEPGKMLQEYNSDTGVYEYHLSLPTNITSQEQLNELNRSLVISALSFFHKKGDFDTPPWGDEYAKVILQFAIEPSRSGENDYPLLIKR